MTFKGWPAAAIEFYVGLEADNSKAYWLAHKPIYDDSVKAPFLALSDEVEREFGPLHVFRPYRDTRFSKDKTPYKTHLGIYFRHTRAAETDAPGVYLHLEPREVFLGAGLWHPGTPALKRIRDALTARPEAWRAAVAEIEPEWRLGEGEPLKRPPAGYHADHPLIDDIKRRSFTIYSPLTQREVTASGFLDTCETRVAAARPFLQFLCKAVGVEY